MCNCLNCTIATFHTKLRRSSLQHCRQGVSVLHLAHQQHIALQTITKVHCEDCSSLVELGSSALDLWRQGLQDIKCRDLRRIIPPIVYCAIYNNAPNCVTNCWNLIKLQKMVPAVLRIQTLVLTWAHEMQLGGICHRKVSLFTAINALSVPVFINVLSCFYKCTLLFL